MSFITRQGASRAFKFLAIRTGTVAISLIIAVYLTIIVANLGGLLDQIKILEISDAVYERIRSDPRFAQYTAEERKMIAEEMIQVEIRRLGLDKPFIVRSFIYLRDALTLNLGRSFNLISNTGSREVRVIIFERLSPTILLFTSSQLIMFFATLFSGLYLSRHYGSKLDKTIVSLAPMSSIPGWFYGIFLIILFASVLKILPYGGMVDAPPPQDKLMYALSVLKHMVLPLTAVFISGFFIGVYGNRTYFLIFSMEDYVEMAKAKGLPPRLIERRYILRPALPPIITGLLLGLIGSWMGGIITERIFTWPGMGTLMYAAISTNDAPVIIGVATIYAFLLAVTVLALDVIYMIVDPRIRYG
ncbi:MAG: ABC transporter permease [Thermoproteota archaeon]